MMGKKSSVFKKLKPILEEAEQLKNNANFEDAVRKYREGITYIRLNVKEFDEREREVENILAEIDQTYFKQIEYFIVQNERLIMERKFPEAYHSVEEAFLVNNKIKNIKLKDDAIKSINFSKNVIKLNELIEEANKLKVAKKFDAAIDIFQKAKKNAYEIYTPETGKDVKSVITNLINQTYLDKISSLIEGGNQLSVARKIDEAIDMFRKAIEICENLEESAQKRSEIIRIEGYINNIYAEKIKPMIEKGKQLIDSNAIQNGMFELKEAEKLTKKMYDSPQKDEFLQTIAKLINHFYIEKIKPVKDQGLKILKEENYEEKINFVNEAAITFKKALDIADEMVDSDEKRYIHNEISILIDNTCSAGINVRKRKGNELIEQKKFEEAIGEMYSAMSIAKNMACQEKDNKEIEDIKFVVNQIYTKQINDLLERGKVFLQQKKHEEAFEIFNEALRISNKMYVSEEMDEEIKKINELMKEAEIKKLVSEGTLMVQQKKFSKELEELQKSLEDADKITNVERKTKKIKEIKGLIDQVHVEEIKFLNEQARLLAEQNKFTDAYNEYEKALQIAKIIDNEKLRTEETAQIIQLYTKELNNEAEQDLWKQEFDKAMKLCQHAIELDNNFFLSYYNMGNVYYGKKEYDEAIKFYQKAVELNPEDKESWSDMGLVYEIKRDFDKALKSLSKAIDIDNNYSPARYRMGNVYKEMNNIEKAIECYRTATNSNPSNANAWLFMGYLFQNKQNYNIALEYYKKARDLDTNIKEELEKLIENFDNTLVSLETTIRDLYKNKKDKV